MSARPPPPSAMPPKPPGPPLPVLLYGLLMVPIAAFGGWVITYGQDEEALERKLREKYGKEIRDQEGRRDQMGEVYRNAIKNPGSSSEQEERLQQVLRGGRGEVKRHHAIDRKYYGTDVGLERQKLNREEMIAHQEEERKKMKKIKKKLKKLKKKKQQQEEAGEGSSSDTESESEDSAASNSTKKKAAAATVAGLALASAVSSSNSKTATTAEEQQLDEKLAKKVKAVASKKDKQKQKKKDSSSSSMGMTQIATLTAVAGTAALIGFLVGGGSRRQ